MVLLANVVRTMETPLKIDHMKRAIALEIISLLVSACSPRRKSYFPLELQELAADLESGTFQLPMEPEIRAAIKREALAATNGRKPSMGLDSIDDFLSK